MVARAAVLALLIWSCNGDKQSITPQVKPLMEAVYASGFVVSDQEYQVFSQADGTLTEIFVHEGESVKKGTAIMQIESTTSSARHHQARETYLQALHNKTPVLNELTALTENARARMQLDSINLGRIANLLKANATTRVEYDRAELQYKSSRNDFEVSRNRLAKTKTDLETAITNARNQLQIAEEESGNHTLRSNIDGVVLKIMKEQGELVRRSEVVAVVGQPAHFYLKLTIDELDVHRVKVGQPALIKIDAFANQILNGTVTKVYPLVDTRQQSLRVDVAFQGAVPALVSGMAAEVNIVLQQKDSALVIPKQLVQPGDSLWVMVDQKKQKVKIVRGIETLDEVEVLSGITRESIIMN
ncbi:MAG: HlyD family efflux transporter periplasmic adaptor subunit [Bacteroidetes bacterium CHB5]|nr:HlyD family efflux transporter periplasmic adaptor subunit [Bacteroidetes bacterium CHB5]